MYKWSMALLLALRRGASLAPVLRRRCGARALASLPKDDAGWMTELSPNQFAVLRQKATEPPGYSEGTEGELEHDLKRDYGTKYPDVGVYECAGCPHRAAQDAPLAGRDGMGVTDRGVYVRRRRAGEGRDDVERDDRGGLQAREELQAVLPPLLGVVKDAPCRVDDVWSVLDPFGRIALAHVGRALGLLVACDASGKRLNVEL